MIQMTAGVFGLAVKNGTSKTIKPMDKNSGPFEADPEQEARLVSLGLAVYVGGTEPMEEAAEQPDADNIPMYDIGMTAKALRELGKEHGLSFPATMSKAEMVAELDELFHMGDTEGGDLIGFDEQPPDDYEDAPSFDPTEAVE